MIEATHFERLRYYLTVITTCKDELTQCELTCLYANRTQCPVNASDRVAPVPPELQRILVKDSFCQYVACRQSLHVHRPERRNTITQTRPDSIPQAEYCNRLYHRSHFTTAAHQYISSCDYLVVCLLTCCLRSFLPNLSCKS